MNIKHDTILLLSGGIDSTAALNFLLNEKNNVLPLYIDYGHVSANNELNAIKNICSYFNQEFAINKIDGYKILKKGMVVGRNAFLLLDALMYTNMYKGIKKVCIGIHRGTDYIDCSNHFLMKMQELFDMYTNGIVQVFTPFITWSKNEIWNYCIEQNLPIEMCYSCELGLSQPCGKCKSCIELNNFYVSKKK